MEDNMMRKESILILPQNTLRLTDVMMQMEIDKADGKLFNEKLDDTIWKLVNRIHKDLSKYNKNIDKSLIDELYEKNFSIYYELSPRTLLYEILDILSHQKFIDKTTVLFSNKSIKKAEDDIFSCDYYDGTIESLENYMNDKNITCLVFDDMELLKTINDRKNVSLTRKTFFVSKMGYNFYRDSIGKLRLKYYNDIFKENPTMELCTIDLFNFPRSVIDKFKKGDN